MNVLEGLFKSATEPSLPLHAGEVFTLWTLYVGATETRSLCQLMLNHTNDVDLKESMEHLVADLEEPVVGKLRDLLAREGVGLPPGTGPKARADEAQIPPGAKLTDAEIANLLTVKMEGMLNICHAGIAQAVRDDIGSLLLMMYQHIIAQAFTLKKTMQQRGWFRYPPLYPFRPEMAGKA